MSFGSRLTDWAVRHYKAVTAVVAAGTVAIALAAALPSVAPGVFGFLHAVEVDTDPENMLSAEEQVRLFHNAMKKRFSLYDMVVVGVVNESDPNGVFNPSSLRKVYALTEFAKQLTGGSDAGRRAGLKPGQGVIAADIIAPSTVDNIVPAGKTVKFEWLMASPPATPRAAHQVLANAQRIPFFRGTMVPPALGDDQALCIYLPITAKDVSYSIYRALNGRIAELGGPEQYYITGLPVAEDTFGVEMFIQMAISAPVAMGIIFVLMLVFFRKLVLVISPMIVALVSVIFTMGSLVTAGFPIHIMSSMIPIFIMPIAVLDSIHIISEFFEKYQATRDRRKTIVAVMEALFTPMLYTSLTSAAGFASLALTPIPPVQVFGIFVAAGIMAAWVLTVTFIPAFVMFIPPRSLESFGARHHVEGLDESQTALARFLRWIGSATYRRAKPILAVSAAVLVLAGYGISRININDNPIKWFTPSHPIRLADRVLNRHFGGTYMSYLALEYDPPKFQAGAYAAALAGRADARAKAVRALVDRIPAVSREVAPQAKAIDRYFDLLKARLQPDANTASDQDLSAWSAVSAMLDRAWDPFAEPPAGFDAAAYAEGLHRRAVQYADGLKALLTDMAAGAAGKSAASREELVDALLAGTQSPEYRVRAVGQAGGEEFGAAAIESMRFFLREEKQLDEVFKRPEVLRHLKALAGAMTGIRDADGNPIVGKSNSLVEIVETVNRDLHDGRADFQRIPNTSKAVGSCITQFQSSHRPQDVGHFVTPSDYRTASMWVQLKSGDNKDMVRVVDGVRDYLAANLPPVPLRHEWFGLTYINMVWQDKMVTGMLQAFAGSFLVVFLLMAILFRSALWGLLSMIPLTVTITAIYGAIGFVGKDYDMPVAVLSSLTLGLAVDFAIHFLARGRSMHAARGSWQATAPAVFGEPARAITRNIIVIAAGFLPLLLAPLMPYKTVGFLLATILLVSGVGTLLILPAMIRLLEKRLFVPGKVMASTCNCALCISLAVAGAALIALTLHQFEAVGWGVLTWLSLAGIAVTALICGIASRREKCRPQTSTPQTEEAHHD